MKTRWVEWEPLLSPLAPWPLEHAPPDAPKRHHLPIPQNLTPETQQPTLNSMNSHWTHHGFCKRKTCEHSTVMWHAIECNPQSAREESGDRKWTRQADSSARNHRIRVWCSSVLGFISFYRALMTVSLPLGFGLGLRATLVSSAHRQKYIGKTVTVLKWLTLRLITSLFAKYVAYVYTRCILETITVHPTDTIQKRCKTGYIQSREYVDHIHFRYGARQ